MSKVTSIFKVYKEQYPNCRLFKYSRQYVLKSELPTRETKNRYTERVFENSYTLLCYLERRL